MGICEAESGEKAAGEAGPAALRFVRGFAEKCCISDEFQVE